MLLPMFPSVQCPICKTSLQGPFPLDGCSCGFNLSGLAGSGTSSFQKKKDPEHRDIVCGRGIGLYGKAINTSFDYYGEANLVQIVGYALTYGERRTIMSVHGGHPTEVIVSFIPDVIGSGVKKGTPGLVQACSGICLMSPDSTAGHDHSFAALDDWVSAKFQGAVSKCFWCGKSTSFGFRTCEQCFLKNGNDWRKLIDPSFIPNI
jgi:hypothetical protein